MKLDFDSTTYETPSSFGALPDGKYLCHIVDSEEKISNSGNKYLNLQIQVLEGDYKNRVLFDIVNLWHPKENVRDIANQTMASICRATKVLKPKSSEELHNKPLVVDIYVETDSQYGEQNRVKKYLPNQNFSDKAKEQVEQILGLPNRGEEPDNSSSEPVKDDIPF